jgi:LysM repeat protein
MGRSRVAHIAVVIAAVALCGALTEGTASAAGAPATAPAKAPAKASPAKSYVVKAGDGGWFQLAQSHHTTLPKLLAANHANASTPVNAGQRIQLPADARTPAKAKTASTKAPSAKPAH